MKTFYNIMVLLLLPLFVFAQEDNSKENKEETLIKDMNMDVIGIFGGPILKVTQINGAVGLMVGGSGGVIFDNILSIGGGGYGLTTNHIIKVNNSQPDSYNLGFNYGGLILEYVHNPNKVIHLSFQTLIGGGSVNTHNENYLWGNNDYIYQNSSVFVFEPSVNLEINMHKYLKLSAGLSYRVVSGSNMNLINDSDLMGLSGDLMFKFYLGDVIGTVKKIIKEVKDEEI